MQTSTTESPPLSASFMWDRREYRRLLRDVTRHAKLPWVYRHSGALLLAAAALAVLVSLLTGNPAAVRSFFPWALILAMWSALFRVALPHLAARNYGKQHPCVANPFHVALTNEGVQTRCDHSDVLVRWSGVQKAVETREFFLFYVSARCAHYLPLRALDGPDAVAAARTFILHHAPLRTIV
jgi:hypothetical protein